MVEFVIIIIISNIIIIDIVIGLFIKRISRL